MRVQGETRIQWLGRLWHLYVSGWTKDWLLPSLVAVVLFVDLAGLQSGLKSFNSSMQRSAWWLGIPPLMRYAVMGVACLATGIFFLRGELRSAASQRWSFARVKALFGAAGITILGADLLLKAAGVL